MNINFSFNEREYYNRKQYEAQAVNCGRDYYSFRIFLFLPTLAIIWPLALGLSVQFTVTNRTWTEVATRSSQQRL